MFRKFLIWLAKNIIILLLITLIFSTIALDVPGMVKEMFKDIFSYASPETQKEVIGKLTGACSGLDGYNSTEESFSLMLSEALFLTISGLQTQML